jgi:SAM-dependent methyltransferase
MTSEEGFAMDRRKDRAPQINRALLWEIIERHLPDDRSAPILDLGGGTGVWALRVAREGYRVVLVDISPGLLSCAREKIKAAALSKLITITQADICDLGELEQASFPLVLALGDPLSYCSDAEEALRQIRRVAVEHGYLIGDVENRYRAALSARRASNWEDAKRILLEGVAHWPDPENPAPIREFTPAEINELLGKTGWSVISLHPSSVVASSVSDEILREVCATEAGMKDVIALEQQLREDSALLGCGTEIQFVAQANLPASRKPS